MSECTNYGPCAEALERYSAMADWLVDPPAEVALQGKRDRLRYGAAYLCQRGGETVLHPLKAIRFLSKVCGLSLTESALVLRVAYRRHVDILGVPAASGAGAIAVDLYDLADGDIVDATAIARFYAWAEADGCRRAAWTEAADILRRTPMAAGEGAPGARL